MKEIFRAACTNGYYSWTLQWTNKVLTFTLSPQIHLNSGTTYIPRVGVQENTYAWVGTNSGDDGHATVDYYFSGNVIYLNYISIA